MVLDSIGTFSGLVHDHLDDLESFFYVLTHIIYACDCHGAFHSIPNVLKLWDKYDGGFLAGLKRGFLTPGRVPKDISARWPTECLSLFYGFRDFCREISLDKTDLIDEEPEATANIQKELGLKADDNQGF